MSAAVKVIGWVPAGSVEGDTRSADRERVRLAEVAPVGLPREVLELPAPAAALTLADTHLFATAPVSSSDGGPCFALLHFARENGEWRRLSAGGVVSQAVLAEPDAMILQCLPTGVDVQAAADGTFACLLLAAGRVDGVDAALDAARTLFRETGADWEEATNLVDELNAMVANYLSQSPRG